LALGASYLQVVCEKSTKYAMKKSNRIAIATLTLALGFALTAAADDDKPAAKTLPPDSTKTNVTYAKDIKPIFDVSCVKCHSGDRPHGHLKLDNLEDVLKGGKDGPVIVPGNSAKSDLVMRVAQMTDDDHEWMPPLHNRANIKPLTPEQIGLIRAWIDQGAK
jgi:Planctomycete cytochrome C